MSLNAFKLQDMQEVLVSCRLSAIHHVSPPLGRTPSQNDTSNYLHSGQLKRVATIVHMACPAAKRHRNDLELCGKCHEVVPALAEKMISAELRPELCRYRG